MTRLLSVVVPAYNEETFIGPLIEAVLSVDTAASGFSKEVIVVDDGSTDGTAAIVRRYPEVRLISQHPNQGRGAALRRGAEAAIGDYILFQDADLEYDP